MRVIQIQFPNPHFSCSFVAKRRKYLRIQGMRPRAPEAYWNTTSRSPMEHNAVDADRCVVAAEGDFHGQ